MPKSQYILKHEQLLRDLKTIIDGLLSRQVANIWSIYGGLSRLHAAVEKIFKHGYKSDGNVNGSYYYFVQGLEWLQPKTSNNYFSIDCEYQPNIPVHLKGDKASIWLYRNLENLTLSTKLGWLLSDRNHLNGCYYSHAFLRSEKYAEATLICLKALERKQPSLMSEINPRLFLLQPNAEDIHKMHRRCSSLPDRYLNKIIYENKTKRSKILERHSEGDLSNELLNPRKEVVGKFKPWSSTPNLYVEKLEVIKEIIQSKTEPSTPIYSKKIFFSNTKNQNKRCTFFQNQENHDVQSTQHSIRFAKKKIKTIVVDNVDIIEHTPPLSNSYSSGTTVVENLDSSSSTPQNFLSDSITLPRSMVDYSFRALPGEKDYKKTPKKSFIEDGGKTILPMSTGYFPKPTKGQSLISFLTSSKISRTNAELDRENAHFSVSEAIISALEQIRYNQDLQLCDERMDDSDPEIMDLKQRIRVRRRQKIEEKQKRLWNSTVFNNGKTDATTSTTSDTYSECSSSDNIDDIEIDEASNLIENKGISISMASLYSEDDIKRMRGVPDGASDVFSAESVAISLISRFKAKQLPKASELEWLVSEKDAPQALLPLPNSWPVNPDDFEGDSVPLRGTQDWAPPRPQIIFTLHPSFTRKQLMIKQNYRCAGCSMRVSPQYASKFRYCEYLGRYFCTGCHSNQLSYIPARILYKWDFTRYAVSTFSYRLLEKMYTDPLFRIFDLNKNIGKIAKDVEFCRRYRLGLFYIKDFVLACRNTSSICETVKPYFKKDKEDIEIYSLQDLVKIKTGEMKKNLKFVVDLCIDHIMNCQICTGRGHICGICKNDDIIFPWQMNLVSRCDKCGTCYHKSCWKVGMSPCKKCTRLSRRRESDMSQSLEGCL
ncbi:hypothetical protein WA026_017032 [Henosepilachna vigintioctopunctata]|uniref:RUN domain-containing protein n=1 Tax=Henosepilachna vigintioctopunctata TaxID=420089 RepID=A0AAW1TV47_9CUCU